MIGDPLTLLAGMVVGGLFFASGFLFGWKWDKK